MKIAIEGCAHGELDKIYETIAELERRENFKVDLLICCGDFQSTRNLDDLACMAVPDKHKHICTFYKYYSGEKTAPILTIFIGGNHEASNYLQELPYGGWVAPRIYYMGYSGCIEVNGIRIAGLSGIYKGNDYFRGHFEYSPYSENTKRSVYHQRQLDVFRLSQLSGKIDVCLSHDWPRGVHQFGNYKQLIRFKPHFQEDIDRNMLGSRPCEELLQKLKPSYWFSAHLHCKFAALIPHEDNTETKFLALDKCLPQRRFLQVLDVGAPLKADENVQLSYDLEWLTILHLTNHLLSVKSTSSYMPGPGSADRYDFTPSDEEKASILKRFGDFLAIPDNFTRTVAAYEPSQGRRGGKMPKASLNMQTTTFCDKLSLDDPLSLALLMAGQELNYSAATAADDTLERSTYSSADEMSREESFNSTFGNSSFQQAPLASALPKPMWVVDGNPDELNIDEEEEEQRMAVAFTSKYSTPFKMMGSDASSQQTPASRSKLVLPSPRFEGFTPTSTPKADEKKAAEGEGDLATPNKKFKRRNLEIYSQNSD